MKPVANITPAASEGLDNEEDVLLFFPSTGIQTPIAPATSLEPIAASLHMRA